MGTKPIKNKSKWFRTCGDATMGFWNPWSHCNKRHEYSKSLGIDILGLGELHNKHLEKQYEAKGWICSEASKKDKQGVNPDPAAGVTIRDEYLPVQRSIFGPQIYFWWPRIYFWWPQIFEQKICLCVYFWSVNMTFLSKHWFWLPCGAIKCVMLSRVVCEFD